MSKGAVRREKMNKSKVGLPLILRLSSLLSFSPSLSWWLLMRECEWYDFKNSVYKFLYCDRGFHKLLRMRQKLTIPSENLEISTVGLRCAYCRYVFFPTVEEKRNYLKITGHNRGLFKEAVMYFKKAKK